jgi:hypothetical protein
MSSYCCICVRMHQAVAERGPKPSYYYTGLNPHIKALVKKRLVPRASPAYAHILLYIQRPHTAIHVSSCYYMCPHTTTYLAPSYYDISSARILLYTCPHTIYVPYCYIRVLAPYFQRPHATTLSCPHTTTSHTTVLHACPHTAPCDAIRLCYMLVAQGRIH